ncbi:MAG: beta-lactamase regulator AmpE [Colwellia sp.]|nr:beta-lactamase regulator AmpE [Colwellia sp.]
MSLLSLLIALAAEKSLPSLFWSFEYYYQQYVKFFTHNLTLLKPSDSLLNYTFFILLPVAIVYGLLAFIGDGLLHLIISTLILIISLGCVQVRKSYKQYLYAVCRGETITAELCHQQLLQDKNLPSMGFGQALIWLNYRYYVAIMFFFVCFGAAGAVFYRILTTIVEQQNNDSLDIDDTKNNCEQNGIPNMFSGCNHYHNILFYLDWLPVRLTSLGYIFVGHFSKALPIWLESLFDSKKPAHEILINVAQNSEDIKVNKDDCTAEPCLLVHLAKRNILLMLVIIAVLTLIGVIN